jgi:hypothetical protein
MSLTETFNLCVCVLNLLQHVCIDFRLNIATRSVRNSTGLHTRNFANPLQVCKTWYSSRFGSECWITYLLPGVCFRGIQKARRTKKRGGGREKEGGRRGEQKRKE